MKISGDKLKESMNELSANVESNAQQLDELVDELVNSCCEELDKYILYVKSCLDDVDRPINDVELDDFIMTIPTLLYFTGNAQESLGIREDVARITELNKYNDIFINLEGTVAAKQSIAKLKTQDESIMTMVYQRACKKIKARIDSAYEILQSCKKVLSRRVSEMELSKTSPTRVHDVSDS